MHRAAIRVQREASCGAHDAFFGPLGHGGLVRRKFARERGEPKFNGTEFARGEPHRSAEEGGFELHGVCAKGEAHAFNKPAWTIIKTGHERSQIFGECPFGDAHQYGKIGNAVRRIIGESWDGNEQPAELTRRVVSGARVHVECSCVAARYRATVLLATS